MLSQKTDCGNAVDPPERIAVVALIDVSDSVVKNDGKPSLSVCDPESVNPPALSEKTSASAKKSPTSTEIEEIACEKVSRKAPPAVSRNGLSACSPHVPGYSVRCATSTTEPPTRVIVS